VSEVEESIAEVDVALTMEKNKEQRLREKLNNILDQKRRVILDIEVVTYMHFECLFKIFLNPIQLQVLLPLGHIEVENLHDPKDIAEAILVPRKTIKQLNSNIRVRRLIKIPF